VSSVHLYLTYPFVLSWSLLEAMSAGCAIVASNTQPVREVITHGGTGLLVDFFSPAQVTESICSLLENADSRARLGGQARDFARSHYDLASICLPRQLDWVQALG
jgi:glycosyltransferase involved in cell wall biosynthesis